MCNDEASTHTLRIRPAFAEDSNKAVVDILFPDTVPNGSLVWVTAFWMNGKSQSGPAAIPVSVNIPGGGVSMAA